MDIEARVAVLQRRLDDLEKTLDGRLGDLEKAQADRLGALERLVEQRFVGHAREHQLLAEALQQARETIDHRLEGMNEFRTQLSSERGRYVERDLFDTQVGHMSNLNSRISMLERGVAVLVALIPIVLFTVQVWLN